MKRSNRLILLIGLFLAVVAFVGVIMLTGNSSSGRRHRSRSVAFAGDGQGRQGDGRHRRRHDRHGIHGRAGRGSARGRWSRHHPGHGHAIGKTIRQSVTKGETLGYSFFINSGTEANVTDGLPRGLRAMAIQVSQVTGVGTLIQNGDHVDVVISMKIQNVIPDPVNKGQVIKVGDRATLGQDDPPERARRGHPAAAADGVERPAVADARRRPARPAAGARDRRPASTASRRWSSSP